MVRYQLLHPMGEYEYAGGLKLHIAYSADSLTLLQIILFSRAEIETYKTLDPGTRVLILKALCDIRVEVLLLYQSSSMNNITSDLLFNVGFYLECQVEKCIANSFSLHRLA